MITPAWGRGDASRVWASILIWGAFLGGALFLGLVVGVGQSMIALAFGGLLFTALLIPLLIRALGAQFDFVFWILLLSVVGSSIISALTRRPMSFVSTALLLCLAPLVMRNLLQLYRPRSLLVWALGASALFYVVGVWSSLVGRSAPVAATYSAVISLKPFLLLALGVCLKWTPRTDRAFWFFTRWAWTLLLAVALLQWFAPGIYQGVFADVESVAERHPFLLGYPRATSLFAQPSILASFCSTLGLFLYIDFLMRRRIWLLLAAMAYLLIVVMSGQRQELLAVFILVPLIYAVHKWQPGFTALVVATALAAALAAVFFWWFAEASVLQELRNWGLADGIADTTSARAVLYSDAFKLANQRWPLGTGFGTFGSVGSVKFDQSLYVQLGYTAFWWFTQKSYLMDSYWSKYIAETGWLGFVLQFAVYLLAMKRVVDWTRLQRGAYFSRLALMSFAGLSYVLLISPTAFSLAEPHGGLLAMTFVGVVWRLSREQASSTGGARGRIETSR
ncbi:MAG: hypothetical protein EOP38_03550 [Rubrivivax sp.]|nr:MAG: hypothetical protein EOP38_03550 [Rubrivivax sp.]